MIDQPAGIVDAQRHSDLTVDIELTAEPFGMAPGAPMLEWSLLAEDPLNGDFELGDVAATIGLTDGSMMRFRWDAGDTRLQMQTIADPTVGDQWRSTTWLNTGPTTTGTVLRIAACTDDGGIRVAWSDGAGVYTARSTDEGSSWGSTETLYTGVDVSDHHIGIYYSNTYVIVGWSTTEPRPMLAWRGLTGGWIDYSYFADYRFAGAAAINGKIAFFSYRDASVDGVGRSWVTRRVLDADTGSGYGPDEDMEVMVTGDAGTNFYSLFYRNVLGGEVGLLGMAIEGGMGGGYTHTLSTVFDQHVGGAGGAADLHIDEPTQARWEVLSLYEEKIDRPFDLAADARGNVYAVNAYDVYSEVWIGRPVTVPETGYLPVSYDYDWRIGRAAIELSADGVTPVIGSMLTLRRGLQRKGRKGSASTKLLVIQVQQRRDRVRVLALDALGWLRVYRARRTVQISDGTVDLRLTVPLLTARCGLCVRMTDEVGDQRSFNITHSAGESGRGALYRLMATGFGVLAVVPGEFAVQLSVVGDSQSEPHRYGGTSGIPITEITYTPDGRRFASSYVLGQRSTDPDDGTYLAGWSGPTLPGVRPLSTSFTNSRYNTPLLVHEAAEAEAMRQLALHVDAVVEAGPNLGLELYDRVQVTWEWFDWRGREFRVHRVIERWDHGALRHELRLGDVAYMYEQWDEENADYDF